MDLSVREDGTAHGEVSALVAQYRALYNDRDEVLASTGTLTVPTFVRIGRFAFDYERDVLAADASALGTRECVAHWEVPADLEHLLTEHQQRNDGAGEDTHA